MTESMPALLSDIARHIEFTRLAPADDTVGRRTGSLHCAFGEGRILL